MTPYKLDVKGSVLNKMICMEALVRTVQVWGRDTDETWLWKCPRRQLDVALESGFVSCFTLSSNTKGTDSKFRAPDYRLGGIPVEVRYDMPEHRLELWDAGKEQLLAVICGIGFPHISA